MGMMLRRHYVANGVPTLPEPVVPSDRVPVAEAVAVEEVAPAVEDEKPKGKNKKKSE